MGRQQKVIDGGGECCIRHVAQPAGRVTRSEDSGEIGKCRDEGEPPFGDPEPRHYLVFARYAAILSRFPAIARLTHEIGEQWLQRF